MPKSKKETQALWRKRTAKVLDWYEAITGIDRKHVRKMIIDKEKREKDSKYLQPLPLTFKEVNHE